MLLGPRARRLVLSRRRAWGRMLRFASHSQAWRPEAAMLDAHHIKKATADAVAFFMWWAW